jgi:hypothetical protein
MNNNLDQELFNQAPTDEPMLPTAAVHTGSMPGFAGLKNKVQFSISLLMNLCHKCPTNVSSQSKAMWVDYIRKQFNIGNIGNGY